MAGPRERCAYCSDSLGSAIDHLIPISPHFEHTFDWRNLYWICDNCNRRKGSKFVRDPETGDALVLRPDRDRPWTYLFLDTETGVITPRLHAPTYEPDERGLETLRVLPVLALEPVVEGRRRAIRALESAARRLLKQQGHHELRVLVQTFKDEHYGVKSWIVQYEGREANPWTDLRAQHPQHWKRLIGTSMPA
ncbi:HNH endonuclease [Agrococcus sp. BE272]|uniref:HNH endonuclease n=1 Tax=Agrococcus sp. BE272 TaxID=2817727 RepID=UPI0037C0BB87